MGPSGEICHLRVGLRPGRVNSMARSFDPGTNAWQESRVSQSPSFSADLLHHAETNQLPVMTGLRARARPHDWCSSWIDRCEQ